jgi:hypothetical protein
MRPTSSRTPSTSPRSRQILPRHSGCAQIEAKYVEGKHRLLDEPATAFAVGRFIRFSGNYFDLATVISSRKQNFEVTVHCFLTLYGDNRVIAAASNKTIE